MRSDEDIARYAKNWDHGWATGQIEQATSTIERLTAMAEAAKTIQGRNALKEAARREREAIKRRFPDRAAKLEEAAKPE